MAALYQAYEGPLQSVHQHPWEKEIFSVVGVGMLLQKGDEYLTIDGKFSVIPVTAIGTYPLSGVTYRRRVHLRY